MHNAETILQAFTDALAGLATTGANVVRGRAYAVPVLPGLSIYMGEDIVAPDRITLTAIERELDIYVEIHIQATGNLETTLNQVRAEIYAAASADRSLGGSAIGLESVVDTRPEISGEQDKPVARQTLLFRVQYRHSATSAET